MFGRRKHVAVEAAPGGTRLLDDEAAFTLLRSRLNELVGAGGSWIVRRRVAGEDSIFDDSLVDYLAGTLTTTLWPQSGHPHAHAKAVAAEIDAAAAAIGWEPDPITLLADLRRPVTERLAVAAAAAAAATRAHASAVNAHAA